MSPRDMVSTIGRSTPYPQLSMVPRSTKQKWYAGYASSSWSGPEKSTPMPRRRTSLDLPTRVERCSVSHGSVRPASRCAPAPPRVLFQRPDAGLDPFAMPGGHPAPAPQGPVAGLEGRIDPQPRPSPEVRPIGPPPVRASGPDAAPHVPRTRSAEELERLAALPQGIQCDAGARAALCGTWFAGRVFLSDRRWAQPPSVACSPAGRWPQINAWRAQRSAMPSTTDC